MRDQKTHSSRRLRFSFVFAGAALMKRSLFHVERAFFIMFPTETARRKTDMHICRKVVKRGRKKSISANKCPEIQESSSPFPPN